MLIIYDVQIGVCMWGGGGGVWNLHDEFILFYLIIMMVNFPPTFQ